MANREIGSFSRTDDHHPIDVSIVIATPDEGPLLGPALESITSSRTSLRYEILVVDDGNFDSGVQPLLAQTQVRIMSVKDQGRGPIVNKNAAASKARGRYLCFIDTHLLVGDGWLDCLQETCDLFPSGALISGTLMDTPYIDPNTPPADHRGSPPREHLAYTLLDSTLRTGWFRHPKTFGAAYAQPLSPGGLMFTQKRYFAKLGGFCPLLRASGVEDVQLSLHNYFVGGENVVDPRVTAYRLCKSGGGRGYEASHIDRTYSCLYVAYTYFPSDVCAGVRESLLRAFPAPPSLISEVEQITASGRLAGASPFSRGFEHWRDRFSLELAVFMRSIQLKDATAGP